MLASGATTVNQNTRISRERRLPQAGEFVVTIGQQVTPVQVIARASQQRGYTIVPAAELLGVAPETLSEYLLVEEGAAIQKKKPLLHRRSLFGGQHYTSPVNGVLYQVTNGRLILQQTPDLFELRAMMHGVVRSFLGNRGIVIETQGALIEAQWGSGREGYGTIKVVVDQRESPLRAEHIGADVRGAVLVAGHLAQLSVLELAEENSVRGVIIGSVPAEYISELSRFRFPILVTEGFGNIAMSTPVFDLLQKCEGREATLLGIAGSTWDRPEIIIPIPESDPVAPASRTIEPLRIGNQVRVWRNPYTGKVGKIVATYKRSQATEVGYRLHGADVALEDGQVLFVPYANLDMIR